MPGEFKILQRPVECSGCQLDDIATGFAEVEGTGGNGVLALGDCLDWQDARDGLPFVKYGQSGSVLERAFGKAGVSRRAFALWNMVACHPPANKLYGFDSAIEHCRVHVSRVVKKYKPRIILAFGPWVLRSFTGLSGHKLNLEMLRGYPLWCDEYKLWVISTYHPNLIARGATNLFPVLVEDIKKAVRWAKDGTPKQNFLAVEEATEKDGLLMLEQLQDCPDLPLSLDIEDDSLLRKREKIPGPPDLTQLNLSTSESSGIVLQPSERNMQTFRSMASLPNLKVGQNLFLYDIPLLEDHKGFAFNGLIEDVMWRFHHLFPDLPMKKSKKDEDDTEAGIENDASEISSIANLQYIASFADFPFPWKHHNTARPGFYGVCDVIAPQMAYWWLRDRMEALGVEDGYIEFVVFFNDTLKDMRKRGIPVVAEVLQKLHLKLIKEIGVDVTGKPTGDGLTQKIQEIVPDILRPGKPALGYKKTPKDVSGMSQRVFTIKGKPINVCKCFKVRKPRVKDQTGFEFMSHMENEYALVTEKDGKTIVRAPDKDCPVCDGTGSYVTETHKESRWVKLGPFNVKSTKQMWDYARYKKYNVPMNAMKKFAMDQETITRLAKSTGDPLYLTSGRILKLSKLDGTYAVGWLREIAEDNCVHPQIGYFSSIGQFGSRRPNSQNVLSDAKSPELAPLFKAAIEAPGDRVMYEADYKGFHNQTLGYEAGCACPDKLPKDGSDPTFIRLAKIDIHTYFSAGLLKLQGFDKCLLLSNVELTDWLKWLRKNHKLKDGTPLDDYRNAKAKHALHGYGNGLQAPGLFRRYPENFDGLKDAEYIIRMLDVTFPEVAEFHRWMPLAAHRGVRLTPDGPTFITYDGEELTNGVITRYGFVRWFHNIKKYDFKRKKMVHGDDWERAMCYPHTNDAHLHIRVAMLKLQRAGYAERFWMGNQVHDAIQFFPLKKDLELCHHIVTTTMAEPSDVMWMPWKNGEGLSVEVDAKYGKRWSEMEKLP